MLENYEKIADIGKGKYLHKVCAIFHLCKFKSLRFLDRQLWSCKQDSPHL